MNRSMVDVDLAVEIPANTTPTSDDFVGEFSLEGAQNRGAVSQN